MAARKSVIRTKAPEEKKKAPAKKKPKKALTKPEPLYSLVLQKQNKLNTFATQPRKLNAKDRTRFREEQTSMSFLDSPEITRIEPKPFLKWVGGKTALLSQITKHFPKQIDRYFEPFLGGGAVFFALKHRFPSLKAFLRDSNKDLINCYRIVRDRPIELMRWLDHHQRAFEKNGDDYFYAVRAEHNLSDDLARAARIIFLNKTCYNGLWRVNAKGEFNTPVGSNKNPNLYSRENLLAASAALQGTQIEAEDFRQITNEAKRGDVIYFDPPYIPISDYSDFKRYTADQFRESDQSSLAQAFQELHDKGCYAILSNSDHPRVRELYSGFSIHQVTAPRFINCKPGGRGNITELLITSKSTPKLRPISEVPEFPETKYMGSKQRLLPFILKHLAKLNFNTVLDAFSGSGCVGYALKQTGVQVYSNDFLTFCFHIARATVENNSVRLSNDDIEKLVLPNSEAQTFVQDTYRDLFFDQTDCEFLDNLWANIERLDSPLKASLALAAISRACMKKRPRGMFTVTGQKGWDARQDLKLSMREQFLIAINAFNNSIFSNARENKAFNSDVFELPQGIADLVYIDSPYISPFSDCDYTRRYHFVEGYCQYWRGLEITKTTTKKIPSYKTAFSTKVHAKEAFRRLFHHFRKSKLAVSYSSNCTPNKGEMVDLLHSVKSKVTVHEVPHKYHHGNHSHKVGENRNDVTEYLFIAE